MAAATSRTRSRPTRWRTDRRHRRADRRARRGAGDPDRARLGRADRLARRSCTRSVSAAVAGLSVPHLGRGKRRIEPLRRIYKDRFFYQLYFQEPGVAEAELEADVAPACARSTTRARAMGRRQGIGSTIRQAGLLEGYVDPDPLPRLAERGRPRLLHRAVSATSGFRGPLNRYRNPERDFEQLAASTASIAQPGLHRGNARSGAGLRSRHQHGRPDGQVVHRPARVRLFEGAGHWVQQERPAEVNAALLEFLGGL